MFSITKFVLQATTFAATAAVLLLNISGLAIFYRWDISYLTQSPWKITESTLTWITVCTYGLLIWGLCSSASAICALVYSLRPSNYDSHIYRRRLKSFSVYLLMVVILAMIELVLCEVICDAATSEPTLLAKDKEEIVVNFLKLEAYLITTAVMGSVAGVASFCSARILRDEEDFRREARIYA
ncbi:hypothetical protein L596_025353 [Steinernema carpocapsae]|uniref:Uncharacterized protein n=1 Tax=Steinernema carpocapsae TaxID=34508 RepID=A0A4U5M7I9_STECR|nr:hypothetical protein L596_025353 [Steinernema carpocapsae]